VRLRIALWSVQVRIAALLIAEALLLGAAHFWITFAFPWYLSYQWYFGGSVRIVPTSAYLFLLGIAIAWRIRSRSDESVYCKPLSLDWQQQTAVTRLCQKVESELGCAIPSAGYLTLSPVAWRNYGCDALRFRDNARGIVVPIGCLGIWSVLDMCCYVGHCAVRRRAPRWFFEPARNALMRLGAERFQHAVRRESSLRARNVERLANRLGGALAQWQLLADIEADRRIAKAYGASAVADWIQRSSLANISVAICLANVIEPAAARGQLLPIAEACRAWHNRIEPHWGAALTNEMRAAEHKSPKAGLNALVIRLGALQYTGGANAPYDPRPSTTLFENLSSLEDAALRNEAPSLPAGLHRTEIAEIGSAVLLPQMQEEVARNVESFKNRSIRDLPELVRCAAGLAAAYREDPRYLFAKSQRELMVPYLLAAFLAVGLAQQGWSVRYTIEQGLLLTNGKREISPETIIRRLSAGEMSKDDFVEILGCCDRTSGAPTRLPTTRASVRVRTIGSG
jgi:hypothetical protein